jgi:hypothetical protein
MSIYFRISDARVQKQVTEEAARRERAEEEHRAAKEEAARVKKRLRMTEETAAALEDELRGTFKVHLEGQLSKTDLLFEIITNVTQWQRRPIGEKHWNSRKSCKAKIGTFRSAPSIFFSESICVHSTAVSAQGDGGE